MAFDPNFPCHQDAMLPWSPYGLVFPQPGQCACADNLVVAISSYTDNLVVVV